MKRHWALLLGLATAAAASVATSADILQHEPRHSPFAYILDYLTRHPGQPECFINEGYLNFHQDWQVDTAMPRAAIQGTNYLRRWSYPTGGSNGSPDVTRTLLQGLAKVPGLSSNIFVAVAAADCDGCGASRPYLRQVLPEAQLHTDLAADTTHGKTVQCTNGTVYLTQNGSVNLQTVGVTTKANTSLVFVETGQGNQVPPMYGHFRNLWHAVVGGSGTVFPGGGGDSSGLDGMSHPAVIGGRPVTFYAGRRNAFVGPTWTDGGLSIPFPGNLFPPTAGELPADDLRTVNWYDQVILDAGTQLVDGQAVTIDIYMFEIGQSNPFIDNLVRLVRHGFVDCPPEGCAGSRVRNAPPDGGKVVAISKKPGARVPASAFPGQLTVNLNYQFQDPCTSRRPCPETATLRDLGHPVVGGSPAYRMNVNRVWQGFTQSRLPGNPRVPSTPQDMHLKLALLTYGQQVRLYVATSNLDTPNVGSGQKWQAGNTIDMNVTDGLYRQYLPELRSIATEGDLSQFLLSGANVAGNSYFDPAIAPAGGAITASGIAAYLFPLATNAMP
jgi:hypothetical protein